MNKVFGPVPSRRLGLSLGLDIIPMKTCSLNCIYCQIGRTSYPTVERKVYVEPELILEEVKSALKNGPKPDYITFSGSGEPTLNSALCEIITQLKSLSNIPIAVITNGLFLWMEEVRKDLSEADVVMPSLDAASEKLFLAVNRPPKGLTLEKVIGGLKQFCGGFKGKIWLEVMLIDGLNTTENELQKLKEVISGLKVDKVQLNTVVRPPAEPNAKPVTLERMKEIRDFFGENTEIIADFAKQVPKIYGVEELALHEDNPLAPFGKGEAEQSEAVHEVTAERSEHILDILKRRPCTAEGISDSLGITFEQIMEQLSSMLKRGTVQKIKYEGMNYYVAGK